MQRVITFHSHCAAVEALVLISSHQHILSGTNHPIVLRCRKSTNRTKWFITFMILLWRHYVTDIPTMRTRMVRKSHWSIYRHRSLTCRTTCGSSWWHVMRSTVRVLEVVLDTIVCVTVTVVSFRSHYPWPMAKLSMNFSVAWVFKWHVLAATWLTKYKEARDSKYSAPRSISDYRWATAMHKL